MAKPFLHWVGGKGRIKDIILSKFPRYFNRYFEPFLGGGAIYLALKESGFKGISVLSDLNRNVINIFRIVKENPNKLLERLSSMKDTKEEYLLTREDFNNLEPLLVLPYSDVKRAAMFLYLNKTCFNGLWRENSKGKMNSPYGYHLGKRKIVDEDNLKECEEALNSGTTALMCAPYEIIFKNRMYKGDFTYLDPPYLPVSKTANFTSYTKDSFGLKEHEELAAACQDLNKRGIMFMLSNSDTPITRELYKDFNIEQVMVDRRINSKGNKRGKVSELLITNY